MHTLLQAGPDTIPIWERETGDVPFVAVALHNGHLVPPELAELMALSDETRLREEDPYTGEWTKVTPNRLVVRRSRFLFDLNRPFEKAVYLAPEETWGLKLWKCQPAEDLVRELRSFHTVFYKEMKTWFDAIEAQWGHFVVLDLHAYNHRREESNAPPASVDENPEINIDTRTMDRERWAPIVERFMSDLRSFDFLGRQLDVRENVRGGDAEFSRWTHHNYPKSACVLAIEVKKIFMDEWTGALYPDQFDALGRAFQSTMPGILEELNKIKK